VLVRLGQEVQEVPRRVGAPPRLADDTIRLEPLTQADVPDMLALTVDADIIRFTRVPTDADEPFVRDWIGRYEAGWEDGSRAGFTVRAGDGEFLGFAALVDLDLEHHEAELGYMVAPAARGRGVASRAVALVTQWAFDELGLLRVELRIDVGNAPSERVAERAGYRLDGVLRNVYFKEDARCDLGVWSRLSSD
jgi:RimJ/RimL family protein N-acetyltransferase